MWSLVSIVSDCPMVGSVWWGQPYLAHPDPPGPPDPPGLPDLTGIQLFSHERLEHPERERHEYDIKTHEHGDPERRHRLVRRALQQS